jgi:hypothetical protein
MTSTSTAQNPRPASDASDEAVFAAFETAHRDRVKFVLKDFVETADPLCERLEECIACRFWQEAVRVAIKLGQDAEALGFQQIAAASRTLAYAVYHADSKDNLTHDGTVVALEYRRIRLALLGRYRDFLAPGTASVA